MVNEAELRDRIFDPIDFICSNSSDIPKGSLLKLTDPRSVAIADSSGCVCAGIAAREKVANDGRTRIAVFQEGIFDMVASGTINVGAGVAALGTNNLIRAATSADSGAAVIGYALETASSGERIQVKLRL